MKSYLITDPLYYTQEPEEFSKRLKYVYQKHTPDFVCFRDKHCDKRRFKQLAGRFAEISHDYRIENIIIHSDGDLALELGATGVHLPSGHLSEKWNNDLIVIVSTHSEEELELSHHLGADYVTISPVFASPHKGEPLGLGRFKELLELSKSKTFALGGIVSDHELELLRPIKPHGFASIRYFL